MTCDQAVSAVSKAATLVVPLDEVPETAEERAAREKAEMAARHRADALLALRRGRGARWAADITGLPLRLVARIAAEHGIAFASPEPDLPGLPSRWDTTVVNPCRLILAAA